jgi:hypothetical protein
MKKYLEMKKIVYRVTSLSVLAVLAACGGDDSSQQNDCLDNIIFLFICAAASTGSEAPDQAPNPAGYSGEAGKAATSVTTAQVDEYEPNNVLNNANIVTLASGSSSARFNVEFRGSVRSTDDVADHFVFTPNRSGSYRIYLCADTCDDSLNDDASYIMLYDQNQTTIASTPVGTIVPQEIEADLTAGLAYYVEINGYNAGADDYSYRLVVSN